jgi:hypothetical protein
VTENLALRAMPPALPPGNEARLLRSPGYSYEEMEVWYDRSTVQL